MNLRISAHSLALSFCWIGAAYGEVLTVGKSRADEWNEISNHKGRFAPRQLAVTSTDHKSELIVAFYPEMGGLGMTVTFFDRPARACNKAALDATKNTILRLEGKPLRGEHVDSFTAGCADERWIERTVLGDVDADIAIVKAFRDRDEGVVRLASADGSFNHSYSVNRFRVLERGGVALYQRSKGYRLFKSMEH